MGVVCTGKNRTVPWPAFGRPGVPNVGIPLPLSSLPSHIPLLTSLHRLGSPFSFGLFYQVPNVVVGCWLYRDHNHSWPHLLSSSPTRLPLFTSVMFYMFVLVPVLTLFLDFSLVSKFRPRLDSCICCSLCWGSTPSQLSPPPIHGASICKEHFLALASVPFSSRLARRG